MAVRLNLTLVCGIAALTFSGCREAEVQEEPVRPVRAAKVTGLADSVGREFPGRARAKEEVDLSFQVSGPLIAMPVDVGTAVKQGDLISAIDPRSFQAALDNAQGNLERAQANLLAMERGARTEEIEQLKAAVQQAEAILKQAQAEHQRNTRLLPSGVVTQSDFDITLARSERTSAELRVAQEALRIGLAGARPEDLEAKRAEIQSLEAEVKSDQVQLDYTVIKAPFDGHVVARYVENFQTVQTQQPIVRMVDVSEIEVTVQVPETLIVLAPQVQRVTCRFDAFGDREFFGRVTKIGGEASQTTRTFPVTVQIELPADVQVLPGMAATVQALFDGEEVPESLVVPPEAVFAAEAGDETLVWVVDESSHQVAQRAVRTGKLTLAGLTVEEGLSEGEWVVTAGVNSLREGQQVRMLQEED